jgi:hypothetical protein
VDLDDCNLPISGSESHKTFEVNHAFNVSTPAGVTLHQNYSNITFMNIISVM